MEVVPYLLALLDDWDDISDTSIIIRDSIDSFINFEEELGEDVEVDEIGEFYLDYTQNHDTEKYHFHQKLAFPGDLAKEMFQRVMIIAANGNVTLKMDFIPSLLSIWTGEKAPFKDNSVIEESSVKEMTSYIDRLSQKSWEKGQKYLYGYKL